MMEGEDEELLTSKPNLHQKTIGRVIETCSMLKVLAGRIWLYKKSKQSFTQ